MDLLLSHVKAHYELLQHSGYYSQVHAQDKQRNKLLDRRLLYGYQDFERWVKTYNGRADLYIGRNPRTKDGKVVGVHSISVDIDPVRPKDTASIAQQLSEAVSAGKRLLSLSIYSQGLIASSGNGCHIYWPLKPEWGITQDQVKQFEDEVREFIKGKYNVRVDSIFDNPRLVKIIGTKATKGDVRLHRVSKFLCPINSKFRFDDRLHQKLCSYSSLQSTPPSTRIPSKEITDRSGEDFRLAVHLLRGGLSFADTCSYLKSKGYKAPEREDKYTIETVRKAQENLPSVTGDLAHEQHIEVFTPATHYEEFTKRLNRSEDQTTELPTGIPTLDSYTGGLKKGGIWVVGARTGIGKTSFTITLADHLLRLGKRVLIFSTEMDWVDTFGRFASMGTGISLHNITNARANLTEDDRRTIKDYATKIKSLPLFVVEEPEPSLRAVTQEISRVRPDVFIFDHIQRVASERDQRYLELAKFIKGLNTVARQYDCAGIINSQLNRMAQNETPALHHLKECGALEEEAHAVLLLSMLSKSPDGTSLVNLDLAKNRGPKGKIELTFNEVIAKFEEWRLNNESQSIPGPENV